MFCQTKKFLCCVSFVALCLNLIAVSARASDLSEALWGGRGSQTTVTQLYVPPPYVTETATSPISDSGGVLTSQSQLLIGTPGAMTLPPGGVVAANGVASSVYVVPSTASAIVPAAPTTLVQVPLVQSNASQPTVESKWSFSTIKDVTYEPVTIYEPRLGGYVTTYQERQTESVLPWLHRKQVVRYKPAAESPSINSRLGTVADRLFPVSPATVSPAQADVAPTLPLQAAPQPMTTFPVTTYASETLSYSTTAADVAPRIVSADHVTTLPSSSASTSSTVTRYGELPVITAVTVPQDEASVVAMPTRDVTIVQSSGSTVISPVSTIPGNGETLSVSTPANVVSSKDVLPNDQADVRPSLPNSGTIPMSRQVLYHPQSQQNTAVSQTQVKQANTPTLAPPLQPEERASHSSFRLNADPLAGDAGQSVVDSAHPAARVTPSQPERIEDSLANTEKLRLIEHPEGTPLPVPTQPAQPVDSETSSEASPSQDEGTKPSAANESQTEQAGSLGETMLSQPIRGRARLNVSPTRVSELFR